MANARDVRGASSISPIDLNAPAQSGLERLDVDIASSATSANGFAFTLDTTDATGNVSASQIMLIEATLAAALNRWADFIDGAPGASLEISLEIVPPDGPDDTTVASAGSESFVVPPGPFANGQLVTLEAGPIHELRTGTDINGSAADIGITLNADILSDGGFFIDSTITEGEVIPANQIDLYSVLLHELGHGLGFFGLRDAITDPLPTFTLGSGTQIVGQTLFDVFTVEGPGGLPFFNGPNATALFGGDIPLEFNVGEGSDLSHFIGSDASAGLRTALLNPFVIPGDRVDIGRLELAVFRDLNLPVIIPDALPLINTVGGPTTGPFGATSPPPPPPPPSDVAEFTAFDVAAGGIAVTVGFAAPVTTAGTVVVVGSASNLPDFEEFVTANFSVGEQTETVVLDIFDLFDVNRSEMVSLTSTIDFGLNSASTLPTDPAVSNGGFVTVPTPVTLRTGGRASADDIINGTDGVDFLFGFSGNDTLNGGTGLDSLDGGLGDDTLDAGSGDDLLDGSLGDDILIGGAGADDLDGGLGNDTASYAGSSAGVTVDLRSAGGVAPQGGDAEGDILFSIENLTGSDFADVLIGGSGANVLEGGLGADSLVGSGMGDVLDGGAGDDNLFSGAGADTLLGGEGVDFAVFNFGTTMGVTLNLATGGTAGAAAGDTFDSIEGVTGSVFDDEITGDGFANLFNGLAGDDLLTGGDEGVITAEEAFVFRVYQATLDRAPDLGGFNFFSSGLEDGTFSNAQIINSFVGSAEFQNTFGSLDDGEFVELLFNNVLDRPSDQGGFNFFTNQLANGVSRASIVTTFINSPEFIESTAPLIAAFSSSVVNGSVESDVFSIFQAALGRQTDADGLAFFAQNLQDGTFSFDQVLGIIVASQEFQDNFAVLSNTEFVESLFQNALGRASDPGGLNFFVSQLDAGTTRASLIGTFIDSPEFATVSVDDLDAFLTAISNNLTDTLLGGFGDDDLVGGIGGDTFIFSAQDGDNDRILDFAVNGGDVVSLVDTSISTVAELVSNFGVQDGADAFFDFGSGNTLRLSNVNLSDLDEDDFSFTAPPTESSLVASANAVIASNIEAFVSTAIDAPVEENAGLQLAELAEINPFGFDLEQADEFFFL